MFLSTALRTIPPTSSVAIPYKVIDLLNYHDYIAKDVQWRRKNQLLFKIHDEAILLKLPYILSFTLYFRISVAAKPKKVLSYFSIFQNQFITLKL
jgi:hypothetical protein